MQAILTVSRQALALLLQSRKMTLENAQEFYHDAGGTVRIGLEQLTRLAKMLDVPLAHAVHELDGEGDDLRDKVKICRRKAQFERLRLVGVQGQPAYLYRHVMKTMADKHLMVLRTSPLFTRVDDASLNGGHRVKEFVYVLSGVVGVLWSSREGHRRSDVLSIGDSIFIDSWVPHSFYAVQADSQILAVDYV